MMVRPAFQRWLRILLPPIVVILAWLWWGDREAQRFQRTVAEMDRRVPSLRSASADDGARFYAAAAVLADSIPAYPAPQTAVAVRDAIAARRQPDPALLAAVRETLRVNEPALGLADRASTMELRNTAGRFALLRSVPVWSNVPSVMSIRTLERVASGDCNGAAESLLRSLWFLHGARVDSQSLAATEQANVMRALIADLALTLQRCEPSMDVLHQLDDVLAQSVGADELSNLIKAQSQFRYLNISVYARDSMWGDVLRPIRYRVATNIALSAMDALDVAAKPWPERVRGMASLPRRPMRLAPWPLRALGDLTVESLQQLAHGYANGVAAVHAGRTALALERYRRTNGRLPEALGPLGLVDDRALDPFTGQSLIYRPRGAGYVLYSAGADGKDDGGSVGPEDRAIVPGSLGKDLGIIVSAPAPLSAPPAISARPPR